jgi:hypothetical protein
MRGLGDPSSQKPTGDIVLESLHFDTHPGLADGVEIENTTAWSR